MKQQLFKGDIVLEKMPMKGGWTYALLPPVIKGGKKNFGWTRVDATIDGHLMQQVSLMPIKGGQLFLAVKAEIRKKIGKEAGDSVHIQLFADRATEEPALADFMEALRDEPQALSVFNGFTSSEQKEWTAWVFSAVTSEEVVQRMASAIDDIAAGRLPQDLRKKRVR
ncbi:MAG: DUF1905 domain-containing protein [Chitinophagaceae bacterium]|nr:DUF1905 domain-containing protein [Chitinophagaceae bacterium]